MRQKKKKIDCHYICLSKRELQVLSVTPVGSTIVEKSCEFVNLYVIDSIGDYLALSYSSTKVLTCFNLKKYR